MLVTNLKPSDLEEQSLSHYQMIREVVEWVSDKVPAIFIGHNSLDFDEDFLRRSFYRTLEGPYFTLRGGNTRADTMVIAHALHHHDTDKIVVPQVNGKPSFRLGPLARINGIDFDEATAHDAFADIVATLDLAKYMRDASPAIWDQMLKNVSMSGIDSLLGQNSLNYLSAVYFGRPYGFAVSEIGRSVENEKEIALFDLAHDPDDYVNLDVMQLISVLGKSPKVIRVAQGNKQPILMPPSLPGIYLKPDGPDVDELQRRADVVANATQFKEAVGEALPQRYSPRDQSAYVEEQIFDGFFTDEDVALMNRFHDADWVERPAIVKKFADERLHEIGNLIICEEAPEFATDTQRDEYAQWINYRKTTSDAVPWTTITKAVVEANDLLNANPDKVDQITEIKDYLISLADGSFE
jgi:exodeoxyribonuclease-1